MSAAAGVVHLDGGQASSRDLELVVESLGASKSSAHTVSSGDARFAFGRRLTSGAIITVSARLDNRDELFEWLEVGDKDTLSDESLIVRAFERWGHACSERLNGDWWLAAWNPVTRELFLARDHFGNTGLYFARVGSLVAFSTDLRALPSLSWLPRRLNETRVASLLIGGGADEPTSTIFRDISQLPPAHHAIVTSSDVKISRYWRVEETPDSGPSDPHARAEQLRATLRSAARTRLTDARKVGAMLSGGLDSGAVTAFAAEYLSAHQQRLTAFTSVPAYRAATHRTSDPGLDEGPRAAEVAQSFDAIDHVLVTAKSVSPIEGIRRGLAIHGEPSIAAATDLWITEILAQSNAMGIDAVLTGQVGDFVMAGRPSAPSWSRDWSERNYRSMVKRLTPVSLQRLRHVEWQPWRLAEPAWRGFSVVSDELAGETRLAERLQDRRRANGIERQATSNVGANWASLGAAFGLAILDPLQDKRVMEQMFSAPRPQVAGNVDRWMFREALAGVLPDHVRLNRRKWLQSADIVARLKSSWTEVEEALRLADSSPLARRCVDMRYCRALAESLHRDEAPRHARRKAFTLVNGLSTALFLAETWK